MDASANRNPGPRSDTPDLLLVHIGHTIWDSPPRLMFASMLLVTVAWPAIFLATAISWLIAWPVLVLCICPIWAGIIAASDRLLDGDIVTVSGLFALIRQSATSGLRIGIVPAVVGTALLALLQLLAADPNAPWIAAPVLLGIGLAIVVSVALVPVFSLANRSELRGSALWLASIGIAIIRPIPVLGTLTLITMMLWVTMVLGPAVLIAAAPLGVVCAGIVREAHVATDHP